MYRNLDRNDTCIAFISNYFEEIENYKFRQGNKQLKFFIEEKSNKVIFFEY